MDCKNSRIQKFYENKTILMTGGTGLLGKLVVEKLLRTCYKVKKIYLIVREKKGMTPEERIEAMFKVPAFEPILAYNPDFRKQVVVIRGDTEQPGLGISEEDRQMIIKDVNIIIHSAATVRFIDPLKKTIFTNVRSTRDMIDLAREVKNLEMFCHISTAFAFFKNTDKKEVVLHEKYEETPIDGLEMIKIVEETDEATLIKDTPKYLGDWPNTYVFSKALAEGVVMKYGKGLPRMMIRPSLIMSAYKEPLYGWIDNKYGIIGPILLISVGLQHVYYGDANASVECIPSDIVVNTIIAAIVDKCQEDPNPPEVPIYAVTSSNRNKITFEELGYWSRKIGQTVSTTKQAYHIWSGNVPNWTCMVILFTIFHTIRGYILDFIIQLAGHKPFLKRTYKTLFENFKALIPFNKRFRMIDDNTLACYNRMTDIDKELFYCDIAKIEHHRYIYSAFIGGKKYILHEKAHTFEDYKPGTIKADILQLIHYSIYALIYYYLYKCAYWYVDETYHNVYFTAIGLLTIGWNLLIKTPSLTPLLII